MCWLHAVDGAQGALHRARASLEFHTKPVFKTEGTIIQIYDSYAIRYY